MWVKDQYVLHSNGIDCKTKELFECYYRQTKDRTSKQKLGKYIKQLGIRTVDVKKETKRYFKYVISAPDLLQAYRDNEWIDEEVDLIDDDSDDEFEDDLDVIVREKVVEKVSEIDKRYEQVMEEHERLTKEKKSKKPKKKVEGYEQIDKCLTLCFD